jgi:hypothetical protein
MAPFAGSSFAGILYAPVPYRSLDNLNGLDGQAGPFIVLLLPIPRQGDGTPCGRPTGVWAYGRRVRVIFLQGGDGARDGQKLVDGEQWKPESKKKAGEGKS